MKARPIHRRVFLTSCLALPHAVTGASDLQTTRRWLPGRWLSDRDRTLQSWYFQGKEIPADQKQRVGEIFGHMTYTITASVFRLQQKDYVIAHQYSVVSETDSSITIRLHSTEAGAVVTFYRAGADELFVKVGANLEYFRRVAA